MIKVIKENLERRYNALLHQKKEGNFMLLEMDYIEYIGGNKLLGAIMRSLINDQRISKKFLQDFFNQFMMTTTIRQHLIEEENEIKNNQKIIFPSFFNKGIEEKYNLFKNFRQMIMDENRAYQEAKRKAKGKRVSEVTDFFDINPSEIINRDDDLFNIQKLHNDLMEKLSNMEAANITNTAGKFVYKKGILYFRDKTIDFNRKPIQKDLLNTLFKKPKYKWTNDEIWEDWGERDLMGKTLKFYTASDEINKTIALDTGIKDFLIKNTKQIQINQKYIE
jgi:hypothetical protein